MLVVQRNQPQRVCTAGNLAFLPRDTLTLILYKLARPVGVDAPRDPDDLIIPSREGALRLLRAACKAEVKRVVMTSAIEAASDWMWMGDVAEILRSALGDRAHKVPTKRCLNFY